MWTAIIATSLATLAVVGTVTVGIRRENRQHRQTLRERQPNEPLGLHIQEQIEARLRRGE